MMSSYSLRFTDDVNFSFKLFHSVGGSKIPLPYISVITHSLQKL